MCLSSKGETIFNSWKDLFTGGGAPFPVPPKIYSFDGRNVLTDFSWYVPLECAICAVRAIRNAICNSNRFSIL